jgi:hypothetical protein
VADFATPRLASLAPEGLKASVVARAAARLAQQQVLVDRLRGEFGDHLVRFALTGESPWPDPSLVEQVSKACGDPAGRGDEVASLLDAVRGRLALAAEHTISVRQVAALAGRSRPAVMLALRPSPETRPALAYIAKSPHALPPWNAKDGAP